MQLYQLGEFNTRSDLTIQGAQVRDFVLKSSDYQLIRQFISQFDYLEQESIIILKRAILAGYWISYYGFGWTKEQEIDFWEYICTKNKQSGVALLTLAESYRGHKVKSLLEVLPLYFEAIRLNKEHFYSFSEEDLKELWKNENYKLDILRIELSLHEPTWSKDEWEEEYPYLIKRCNGDKEMEEFINKMIEKILSDK